MCAGLDVRGGGPASRESELLKPLASRTDRFTQYFSAVEVLSDWMLPAVLCSFWKRKDIGFDVGVTKVPLVCQSDIFDLTVADPHAAARIRQWDMKPVEGAYARQLPGWKLRCRNRSNRR
ncbi:MAG: hypothetical protein ACLUN4_11655 [Lachnospiraceae bacterium]